MSAAAEEVVTEGQAVEAVPKRAMTLGTGTSLVILALLLLTPLFVKNFIIFQMTMVLIYGLAILALNILTGGSGQFSLGQSAFYAIGAYTTAVLMEHGNVNYALTLPIAGAGVVCRGLPVRPAGVAAVRHLPCACDLRARHRHAAAPEAHFLEHWTGGVQGLVITKPDAPFGLPVVAGHVAVLLHAGDHARDLCRLGQPAALALGPRHDGDPRQ